MVTTNNKMEVAIVQRGFLGVIDFGLNVSIYREMERNGKRGDQCTDVPG